MKEIRIMKENIEIGRKYQLIEELQEAELIHLKGYIFDSLVFRYEKARNAQMLYEQAEERKKGSDGSKAKSLAERDKMRFIQILNEAIGEHD